MSSTDESDEGFQLQGFAVTFYVSIAVGGVLFLFFFFARHYWKWFYTPKSSLYFPEEDWSVPEEFANSWFYWAYYVYKYPEEKLYQQKGGFDTIIYLRFLKTCIIYFFILSIWGLVAILPINYSGSKKDLPTGDPGRTLGNAQFSMSNLVQNSPKMYMHLFSIGLFSCLAYYFMYRMYQTGIELNKLEHTKNHLRSRTIMISELSSKSCKNNQSLEMAFSQMYRKQVLMAQTVPRNTKLRELIKERRALAKKFYQTCDIYIREGANSRPILGPLHILHLDLPKSVWASLQTQQFKHLYSSVIGDAITGKKGKEENKVTEKKSKDSKLTTFSDVSGGKDPKGSVIPTEEEAELEMGVVAEANITSTNREDYKDHRLIELPGTEEEEEKRHLQSLFLAQRYKLYKKYISKKARRRNREPAMLLKPEEIEDRDIPEDYFDAPPPLPETQRQPHGLDLINFFEELVNGMDRKIARKQRKVTASIESKRENEEENQDILNDNSATSGFDTDHAIQSPSIEEKNGGVGLRFVKKNVGMTRVGFVTFKYVGTAMAAAQSLHSSHKKKWIIKLAPDPKNIIWANLSFRHREQFLRSCLCGGALFGLFAFYTIPVTAISAFTNLNYLRDVVVFRSLVNWLESNSFLKGVVGSFLPTLALQIFMALLPIILKFILKNGKYYLKTELEMGVTKAYWTFLLLNVFLVTSLTGSLFKIINDVFEHPTLLISLLASSLPSQAEFFIEYMIVSTFVQYPFQICKLIDFGLKYLNMWSFCYTETERREIRREEENFDYVKDFSEELLAFSIGLTYSVMQPIILPFTFLFFVFAHFVQRHQFVFVIRTKFEGYQMLEYIINILTLSCIIFQITMTGVFALQLFPAGSIFCALMIAVTIIVYYFLRDHYLASSYFVPMRHCDTEKLVAADDIDEIARMYRDPSQKKTKSLYKSIRHLRTDEEIEVEPEAEMSPKGFKIGQAKQKLGTFMGSFFKMAANQGHKLEQVIMPMGSLEKAAKQKTMKNLSLLTESPSKGRLVHSESKASQRDHNTKKEEEEEGELISDSSDEGEY
eukprot:TRINITY_DN3119_c0_g1_i1.p1 TRINITY_DN3119_c0_g1~~TRINITY_DN3119_c0_g1_i1.p1  ORF type:complete len:1053 (+),score=313.25 TRINITY_DN3119_c0_g1_i1:280-3438(+)